MNERDQFAYTFIQQATQKGMSRDEIRKRLQEQLDEYDRQQREAFINDRKDKRTLGQKAYDTVQQYSGAAGRLGEAVGNSLAAGQQANANERAQIQQQGLDDEIMQKVRLARMQGNEQEAQRLLQILNDPQYQIGTDAYNQQVQDYRLGQQRAVQGAVGTAADFAMTAVPGAQTVGQAALQGSLAGATQGAALSNADLVNQGQYNRLLADTAIGGAAGAAIGAGTKLVTDAAQSGVQKIKDKINGIKSGRGNNSFSPMTINEYERQASQTAAQTEPAISQTAKTQKNASKVTPANAQPEVIEQVASVSEMSSQPQTYRDLTNSQRRQATREISEFYIQNGISNPRQVGKAYNPRDTFLEINQQLNDQGMRLSELSADDVLDLAETITGDKGATTQITREIIADNTKPLSKFVKQGSSTVDPVMTALDESFKKSSKLRTNKKAQKEIKDLIQSTLDEAANDLNTYDVPKLFDALRDVESYAAEAEQIANKSIMPSLADKQTAKAYRAAADEISNIIDKASVDTGVFQAGRDRLANYYRGIGMNRLADQVASAKNLSQLRSTAKPWVRAGILINDGQAAMFSTFNQNSRVGNQLLQGAAKLIPGSRQLQGVLEVGNALSGGQVGRNVGYAVTDAIGR